jgi:SPP1 gp7 family putative phage head morphogenesis protein
VKSATLTNARLITSIEDKFLDDVAILIQDSYRSGLSANSISKQIKDKFGITENRARLIARDQIGKLHSDIVRDEHLSLGITEYKWLTSNDERVRASHKVLNEKICSWYDPTIYKDSVDDKKWKKRSSIGGVEKHPGQDYQCRCDEIAILK